MTKTYGFFVLILCFIFSNPAIGQNNSDFFKAYPVIDQDMPNWAHLMYQADPNVFEVQDAFDQYTAIFGFEKTTHVRNYRHWIRQVLPHVNKEGFIRLPSAKASKEKIQMLKSKRSSNQKNTTNWIPLGPFETYVQGTTVPYSLQTNVYSIDVYAANTNILICGSETGTAFYTNDKGLNWQTISDHAVFSGGVTAVKIHPADPTHFFIGVDNHIYETKDGGANWIENYALGGSANEFVFDPSNVDHVFCSASSGLFESIDGGQSWNKLLTTACYDVNFHPTDPQTVYALLENQGLKRCEIFKSTDNGTTWDLKSNGWYSPSDPANAAINGGKIGVSLDDPSRVYVCLIGSAKLDDNGWIGVYRSDDQGENWYNPVGQDGGPYQAINTTPWNVAAYGSGYHQGYYNFDLEVSPNNADLMWIGTIRLSESEDGGFTFKSIGAANSTRLDNQHADIQDIEVIGNEVWVASDGGINYSDNNEESGESRKNGVNGADFWGFGSGWNEDILVGGKYHNGNSAFYQTYDEGIFHHVGGVEESTGYVHPMDSRKAFFNKYWAGGTETVLIPEYLGGPASYQGIFPYIPNESYTQSWSSGFYFDPRYSDHIYMGEGSSIWKSENGGNYFEALNDFGTERKVLEVKISRANPDVLYTVVGGPGYWDANEMYRSEDGGANWTLMNGLGTNMWRVELSLNPLNESEIWACANNGSDGNKVYQSMDKGASWVNKTTAELNGESFRDICYQEGSDGVVFLASQYSVKRFNPATDLWEDCSSGLPFVPKGFELRPFYRDQKIRIGTYGKGIWEAPLESYSSPIAQPMTHSDKVYCARDTVQFDCYSILAHEGASWEWTISPDPMFVSNLNSRNPKVVFGGNGSFDVSLKITDQLGNTSEQTINDMVEVLNYCNLDTFPGLALQTLVDGDYAQTKDFNTEVTQFSITAWVKPEGIQPDYSSIYMNDGQSGGFNFKNGDNSLAYHWPGGQWYWNSGLIVPEDEWSHVAMVVTPDSVTLYVNGIASTHTIQVESCLLGTGKLGSYKAWGGRNYKGLMDEVAMWNRALSQDEVREYRHLTKEDYDEDPFFLAYYQFNAPVLSVLDRISNHHASLSGGSEKVVSEGPFGGGTASAQQINNFGVYEYSDEGATMKFTSGLIPDGEVYLSRINLDPNVKPNDMFGPMAYWIINNYGENEIFDAMGELSLDPPYSSPTTYEIDDPSLVQLHSRSVNDDDDNWLELCDAISADSERYIFGPDCEISFEGQFQFTSNEPDTTSSTADLGVQWMPKVFPNPVLQGQQITIKNDFDQDFEWTIMNSAGAVIKIIQVPAGSAFQWDVDDLSAGAYLYKFKNSKYLKSGLLMIE